MVIASYEDWSDFYAGSPDQTYISGASRITPTSGNAHVKRTLFKNLSPSQSGGAIYCNSISLLFLAEETSFISCTPTGQGGAMYLAITGESVLSKVCGFCCLAKSNLCQFDHIQVSQDITKKNQIIDSSICRSETSYSCIIFHYYGKQSLNSINNSHNKIYDRGIHLFNQGTSSDLSIKYCSFVNNTACAEVLISLYTPAIKKLIYTCNVINNERKTSSSSVGLIRTEGITKIENSCILGNKGSCIVCVVSGSGSSISNCTIDFTSSNLISITITSAAKYSFINRIECLSTAACEAMYDSYDDLTLFPTIKVKKSRIACTCKRKQTKWNAHLIFELLSLVGFIPSR